MVASGVRGEVLGFEFAGFRGLSLGSKLVLLFIFGSFRKLGYLILGSL